MPAAVVLFLFRTPIVQTLFQTGAFSADSTALVAAPLGFLAAGLVSYALVEALARAFYAMHDTRTPVIAGIAIIVLNKRTEESIMRDGKPEGSDDEESVLNVPARSD